MEQATPQVPLEQVAEPYTPGLGQTLPQEPQLFTSVCVSSHVVPHCVCVAEHMKPQLPIEQTAVPPLVVVQTFAQAPQSSTSDCRSTHPPVKPTFEQ